MDSLKVASVVAVAIALLCIALGEQSLAIILGILCFVVVALISFVVGTVQRHQHGKKHSFFRFARKPSRGSYYYYDWET